MNVIRSHNVDATRTMTTMLLVKVTSSMTAQGERPSSLRTVNVIANPAGPLPVIFKDIAVRQDAARVLQLEEYLTCQLPPSSSGSPGLHDSGLTRWLWRFRYPMARDHESRDLRLQKVFTALRCFVLDLERSSRPTRPRPENPVPLPEARHVSQRPPGAGRSSHAAARSFLRTVYVAAVENDVVRQVVERPGSIVPSNTRSRSRVLSSGLISIPMKR